MKIKFTRLFLSVFLVINFFSIGSAQLSIFNKIDTFKGCNPKLVPLDYGFLAFNSPLWYSDSTKFYLSKFDECGDLEWTNRYYNDMELPKSQPDVLKDNFDMFLLLEGTERLVGKQQLVLVKIDINGDISWSKELNSVDDNLDTHSSNILFSRYKDFVYLITSDREGNCDIISLDTDGEILDSKKLVGMKHRSSVLDTEGNLIVFSDSTLYAKIHLDNDMIDTVMWVKKIENRFFAHIEDPVVADEENISNIITVVVDTILRKDTVNVSAPAKLDTAIYRLVKINSEGNIIGETDGFLAPDYDYHKGFLKVLDQPEVNEFPVYFMIGEKVMFFTSNFNKFKVPRIYKFAEDSFKLQCPSLEICKDVSLVMSGFCYKMKDSLHLDYESPYMFVSKTQPDDKDFKVESEEGNCLNDSMANEFITLSPTISNDSMLSLDTMEFVVKDIEFKRENVEGLHEDKCGKVNMMLHPDTVTLCPGESEIFMAHSIKGARYKWSTGEVTPSIIVSKAGEYSVEETLCDTVRNATFVYKYDTVAEHCFTVYYPNAFFPTGRTDSLNSVFKVFQKKPFTFDLFEMKIFDRWGEKVFETTNPDEGWDGTFRGKPMPPGVYLYNVKWKVVKDGQDFSPKKPKTGQVILLR